MKMNAHDAKPRFWQRQFHDLRRLFIFGLLGVGALAHGAAAQEPEYDLVLRGGRIVDGTGNPWFLGDVAIRGDRIVAVGDVPKGKVRREIDARGLVVAPGFIDIHSHSDWTLLQDGDAHSKIRQGVTTEVLGEGSSGGPQTGKLPPQRVEVKGKAVSIVSLADYFRALEDSTISVNDATPTSPCSTQTPLPTAPRTTSRFNTTRGSSSSW